MFSRLLPKISASLSNLHLRGSVYFLQGFSHHESFAAVDLLERESPKGKDCAVCSPSLPSGPRPSTSCAEWRSICGPERPLAPAVGLFPVGVRSCDWSLPPQGSQDAVPSRAAVRKGYSIALFLY